MVWFALLLRSEQNIPSSLCVACAMPLGMYAPHISFSTLGYSPFRQPKAGMLLRQQVWFLLECRSRKISAHLRTSQNIFFGGSKTNISPAELVPTEPCQDAPGVPVVLSLGFPSRPVHPSRQEYTYICILKKDGAQIGVVTHEDYAAKLQLRNST